jgi:hypothetical protein
MRLACSIKRNTKVLSNPLVMSHRASADALRRTDPPKEPTCLDAPGTDVMGHMQA